MNSKPQISCGCLQTDEINACTCSGTETESASEAENYKFEKSKSQATAHKMCSEEESEPPSKKFCAEQGELSSPSEVEILHVDICQ